MPPMRRLLELALVLVALAGVPGAGQAQAPDGWPTFRGTPPADVVVPDMASHVDVAWAWVSAAFDAVRDNDLHAAAESLSRAREILGKALAANPYCRDAAVGYGVAMFYQAYYLDEARYPDAIEFLTRILEVDPYAADAARYLASAYAQLGDGGNVRYYARYVEAVSTDAQLLREMADLVRPFEEAFLDGWYDHADYYGRPEAKVTVFNPRTFQVETLVEVTPQFEMSLGQQGFARMGAGGAPPPTRRSRPICSASWTGWRRRRPDRPSTTWSRSWTVRSPTPPRFPAISGSTPG